MRLRITEERFCVECQRATVFVWDRCIRCRKKLPKASKLGNVPKRNKITGRLHQSTAEANFASTVVTWRNAGLVSDIRGLDRGDPQERFRLEVYGTKEVEALLEVLEASGSPELRTVVRDVRRSKVHICDYVADFTMTSQHHNVGPVGERLVYDVKGNYGGDAGRRYQVKKRLMLACHGMEIQEVRHVRGRR